MHFKMPLLATLNWPWGKTSRKALEEFMEIMKKLRKVNSLSLATCSLRSKLDGDFLFDASILDANTLVTAAHCLYDLIDVTVTTGTINWMTPGPNAQIRFSTDFDYNSGFSLDEELVTNDIGYIKVDEHEAA